MIETLAIVVLSVALLLLAVACVNQYIRGYDEGYRRGYAERYDRPDEYQ